MASLSGFDSDSRCFGWTDQTHTELQAIDPRRSQELEEGCGFVAAESGKTSSSLAPQVSKREALIERSKKPSRSELGPVGKKRRRELERGRRRKESWEFLLSSGNFFFFF